MYDVLNERQSLEDDGPLKACEIGLLRFSFIVISYFMSFCCCH